MFIENLLCVSHHFGIWVHSDQSSLYLWEKQTVKISANKYKQNILDNGKYYEEQSYGREGRTGQHWDDKKMPLSGHAI